MDDTASERDMHNMAQKHQLVRETRIDLGAFQQMVMTRAPIINSFRGLVPINSNVFVWLQQT